MPRLRHYVGPCWPLDVAAYDYAVDLCPSDVAWEFLRRNSDYQRDFRLQRRGDQRPRQLKSGQWMTRLRRAPANAGKWGVYSFCDPKLSAPQAGVCWTIGTASPTLDVIADRSINEPDLHLHGHVAVRHMIVGPNGREHVVLRDAHHAVTLRVEGARVSLGGIIVTFLIKGVPNPVNVAPQFSMLNHLIVSPRVSAQRSRTRIFMRDALVALDARQLGATYRETATMIHGAQRARAAWSSTSNAMKERMRHLLARGQALRDGAYRSLLG